MALLKSAEFKGFTAKSHNQTDGPLYLEIGREAIIAFRTGKIARERIKTNALRFIRNASDELVGLRWIEIGGRDSKSADRPRIRCSLQSSKDKVRTVLHMLRTSEPFPFH